MRKHFRQIRQQIPFAYRKSAALSAAEYFSQHYLFKQSQYIACYFSYKDEFETTAIIKTIWQANKNCYLPILTQENSLHFVLYKEGDALKLNRYSIAEPKNVSDQFAANNLDIVITPLIAFDLQGHRLGTGGGYYDRTFAFLKQQEEKKPLMMGLAYASQEAKTLPYDEWDISLDTVLSEKGIIY